MTYISVLFQLRARLSSLFWFFFFKQKTAYEMRISDWSSDVCSSDLYRRKRYGCGGVGGWRRERRRDPEHQPRERRRHQVRQAAREQRLQAELGDHRALVRGEPAGHRHLDRDRTEIREAAERKGGDRDRRQRHVALYLPQAQKSRG